MYCVLRTSVSYTTTFGRKYLSVVAFRPTQVLEGKSNWIEMAGNLVPVTKSGEQLHLPFRAFRENRLPFTIRIRDTNQEPVARVAFMRDPKQQRGDAPQTPICSLNIELPEYVKVNPRLSPHLLVITICPDAMNLNLICVIILNIELPVLIACLCCSVLMKTLI